MPIYVVRYFKGEETRTLSKHLFRDAAVKVANRFIKNLKEKRNLEDDSNGVLISLTQLSNNADRPTILTLTRRAQGSLGEGVRVDLETQRDPNWDYAKYTDLSKSDGGHVTTAGRTSDSDKGDTQ